MALMDKWHASNSLVVARQNQLLLQQQHLSAGDEADALVAGIERCQIEYALRIAGFLFAFYGEILTPQQVCL